MRIRLEVLDDENDEDDEGAKAMTTFNRGLEPLLCQSFNRRSGTHRSGAEMHAVRGSAARLDRVTNPLTPPRHLATAPAGAVNVRIGGLADT